MELNFMYSFSLLKNGSVGQGIFSSRNIEYCAIMFFKHHFMRSNHVGNWSLYITILYTSHSIISSSCVTPDHGNSGASMAGLLYLSQWFLIYKWVIKKIIQMFNFIQVFGGLKTFTCVFDGIVLFSSELWHCVNLTIVLLFRF